jgi:hypothetical protein
MGRRSWRRGVVGLVVLGAAAGTGPNLAGAHVRPLFTDGGAGADAGWLAAPARDAGCPTQVDPQRFASADALYAANERMAGFGERPTGTRNHRRFINALEAQLAKLPGVQLRSIAYPIDRWTPDRGRMLLRVRDAGGKARRIRLAGPLPYAADTPRGGAAGRLAYLPPGQPIEGADVRGKVLVRDTGSTKLPNAALAALQWWTYDPEQKLTLDIGGDLELEDASATRVADMQAAAKAGALGVVFVHGLPHEQIRGQYAPYEGIRWPVPALFVGADEGQELKDLAAKEATARIRLTSTTKRVKTRMLLAELDGLSDERIVVQSHTDGMNAVWDNGPVAMVEIAEWFARIGKGCRPRKLLFAFTTGHLYQHLVPPSRDGSAEQLARQLDDTYDQGSVAAVLPLEHLGAKRYLPKPRGGGKPGRTLVKQDRNEPNSLFISESPGLVASALQAVQRHDLREAIALRGADLPGLQLPPHDSFGGEGNPYLHHLIPTAAFITGPWTLFNPDWTIDQLVDRALLHRQALVWADLVHLVSTQPRELLGGAYVGYRAARELTCGTALEALNLVRHCTVP